MPHADAGPCFSDTEMHRRCMHPHANSPINVYWDTPLCPNLRTTCGKHGTQVISHVNEASCTWQPCRSCRKLSTPNWKPWEQLICLKRAVWGTLLKSFNLYLAFVHMIIVGNWKINLNANMPENEVFGHFLEGFPLFLHFWHSLHPSGPAMFMQCEQQC